MKRISLILLCSMFMGTGYFQVIKFDNGVTVNSLIGNEFDLFFNVGAFALVIAIAKP